MDAQRVVVIQDASREISSSAIRWALYGLSLKPGDSLTLVAVLHQVNTPSTLSFMGGWKPLGYKSRVDSSSMLGANERIVDRAAAKKKEEYENSMELIQISKLYEIQKVEFKIEVAMGPSPKAVALKSAENLKATWVILDRQMKKDKKFFLRKLSCGISRMKRNNSIEQLRGPKSIKSIKGPIEESRNSHVTYDEMMPGSPEEQDLFSIELFPKSQTEAHQVSQNQELTQSRSTEDLMERWQAEDFFGNYSTCTICENIRPNIEWKRDFTYAELLAATDGFSSKNSLSEGEFGSAFRGQLKSNLNIVVKQNRNAISHGEMKFKSEVHVLIRARHKNVLMLLGTCIEESQKLLVYEYACNGSLNQHLSQHSPAPLTWTQRIKIALGASRGLHYLHENNIIHRNVRPKNILLTHDLEPLLGGFGLARTQSDQYSQHKVVGSSKYLASEYAENGNLSTKADVYSFGVVLLELITGRRTTDEILGHESLVGWARPLLKERRYLELVDPRIINFHDAHQLFWMVRITHKCLSKNPQKRIAMDRVVSTLEYIADRYSSCATEAFPPTKSYLAHSMTDSNGLYSYEKTLEQESSCEEVNVTIQMSRSVSLASSATISTGSTSFRKSSSSNRSSHILMKAKSGSAIQVHYGEMF